MKRLALYDTTLRDAGSMSVDAKLLVAQATGRFEGVSHANTTAADAIPQAE